MQKRSEQRKRMLAYTSAYDNFFPKSRRSEFLNKTQPVKEIEEKSELTTLTCLSCDTDFPHSNSNDSLASPGFLSMFTSRFSSKFRSISFRQDSINLNNSLRSTQLLAIRRLSLNLLKNDNLEPSENSKNKTKTAAKEFFALASKFLHENDEEFPLAGKNKCIGLATIKNNKTVFIAISQDEVATRDLELRKKFIKFLKELNKTTTKWRFELVNTPSAMEYLLPRTLRMGSTPRPASSEEINPRMRCVEIHLMVALNKAHRTLKFKPADVAMVAFSGTLWAHQTESMAAAHFGNVKRNIKYLMEPALEVNLHDGSKAYVDVWEPCKEHCAIYYKEMLAIIFAGEHLYGERADEPFETSALMIPG